MKISYRDNDLRILSTLRENIILSSKDISLLTGIRQSSVIDQLNQMAKNYTLVKIMKYAEASKLFPDKKSSFTEKNCKLKYYYCLTSSGMDYADKVKNGERA